MVCWSPDSKGELLGGPIYDQSSYEQIPYEELVEQAIQKYKQEYLGRGWEDVRETTKLVLLEGWKLIFSCPGFADFVVGKETGDPDNPILLKQMDGPRLLDAFPEIDEQLYPNKYKTTKGIRRAVWLAALTLLSICMQGDKANSKMDNPVNNWNYDPDTSEELGPSDSHLYVLDGMNMPVHFGNGISSTEFAERGFEFNESSGYLCTPGDNGNFYVPRLVQPSVSYVVVEGGAEGNVLFNFFGAPFANGNRMKGTFIIDERGYLIHRNVEYINESEEQ